MDLSSQTTGSTDLRRQRANGMQRGDVTRGVLAAFYQHLLEVFDSTELRTQGECEAKLDTSKGFHDNKNIFEKKNGLLSSCYCALGQ